MRYRMYGLILIVLASGAALADLQDGLVARYPLEADANDASGNGHHGSVHGDPAHVDGICGLARDFDGQDDYIEILDHQEFELTTFTVAAWIKPLTTQGSSQTFVFSKGEDPRTSSNGPTQYSLVYHDATFPDTPNKTGLFYEIWEGPHDPEFWYMSSSDVEPGVWTHVAVTRDPLGRVAVYINGELDQDYPDSPTPELGSPPLDSNMQIGARFNCCSLIVDHFTGTIDEVHVYNRALPQTEVEQLYTTCDVVVVPTMTNVGLLATGLLLLGLLSCLLIKTRRREAPTASAS